MTDSDWPVTRIGEGVDLPTRDDAPKGLFHDTAESEPMFADGQCRYLLYKMPDVLPEYKLSWGDFTPVLCDSAATQTVVRRSHRHPHLAGPIEVCDEHAERIEQESKLDDALAEGSLGREIDSANQRRCLCEGHEHVGKYCPRPCGCAVRP